MRTVARVAIVIALFCTAGTTDSSAQTIEVSREHGLYWDMRVAPVGPLVATSGQAGGVLSSWRVQHDAVVPAVRVHVEVRRGRAAADWRIRFRDLTGRQIESVEGGSSLLSSGGVWSGEIPGRGVQVELVTDTDAQGLEIVVDRYAYRVISAIPMSIFGADQRIPIRQAPASVRGVAGPIAKLSFISGGQQYVCTGFLLTESLLLTNEHCLGTVEVALSAIAEFGFDTLDATPTKRRVRALEAASAPLDYALVRLDGAAAGFGRVVLDSARVAAGRTLAIVQHPAGEYKQASIDDCGVSSVLRPGITDAMTDFGHTCDTLGGASGSPVFDRQTGRVIGLHHLGFHPNDPQPVNQGVHIGLVLADIGSRWPQLHAEILANGPN